MKGDGDIMLTYLLIGLLVQVAITTERVIRKVAGNLSSWTLEDVLVFIICASVNVLFWPIAIGFEVYNVVNGY